MFYLTKLCFALQTLSELKYKKNALVSFTDSILMIMEILQDTSTPSKPILWAKWEIGGKIGHSKNLFSLLSTRQHQSENPTSEMCLRNESTSNNRNKKSLTKENGSSISSLPDGYLDPCVSSLGFLSHSKKRMQELLSFYSALVLCWYALQCACRNKQRQITKNVCVLGFVWLFCLILCDFKIQHFQSKMRSHSWKMNYTSSATGLSWSVSLRCDIDPHDDFTQ